MRQIQTKAEIVPMTREVCMTLTCHANDNEVRLMLGTWAAENGQLHRKQILGGGKFGKARGLWQMEPETAQDIFENYLSYRKDRWRLIMSEFLNSNPFDHYWTPPECEFRTLLVKNDRFACAMARLQYLRRPEAIPEGLEVQGRYWLEFYNCGGKGTLQHYVDQWFAVGCEELLRGDA